jgi:hypothetical protein
MALVRADVSAEHVAPHVPSNETLESSQVVASIRLTTESEESLFALHPTVEFSRYRGVVVECCSFVASP